VPREPASATDGGSSLTARTRAALIKAVGNGVYPGGRLPAEPELAADLGVSRTTIRAVLQSFEEDGLVSRRRGRGTYVDAEALRSTVRLNRLAAFADLIAHTSRRPSVGPQEHRILPAGEEIAATLGIEPEALCVRVDRILLADDVPVIRVHDVLPVSELRDPQAAVLPAESTFAFVAANGRAPVAYATAEFVPRVATDTEPARLLIDAGTPYIQLIETHFNRDSEMIAVSLVDVDVSAVRLTIVRRNT